MNTPILMSRRALASSLAGLPVAGALSAYPAAGAAATPKPEQTAAGMPPLFLEDVSPKPMVATTSALRAAIEAAGWSVLGATNMTGVLAERGQAVPPVLVFDICSSQYSAELLSNDAYMYVASMMPCSVAVYQTSQGKVVISRMNSAAMGGMVGGRAGEIVAKSGQDLEQIVKAALARLAA